MTISASSGSIYPGNAIVEEQFNAKVEKLEYFELPPAASTIMGNLLPLSSAVCTDLLRFGTFAVNGVTIYSPPSKLNQAVNKVIKFILPKVETADVVREQLSQVVNKVAKLIDLTSTKNAFLLLQQMTALSSLTLVFGQKGIYRKGEPAQYGFASQKSFRAININESSFETIDEQVIRIASFDDPEDATQYSYLKIKTVIKGLVADLAAKNSTDMKMSILYTKEYTSMDEVFQADYFEGKGQDDGWDNRKSYIHA